MIGKTNTSSGSSLSFKGALICIIAPIGSTITLMKNNLIVKTLYPKNQHIFNNVKAYWYYSVTPSNYGEWTVTASLETVVIDSNTVTINSNKQYNINLNLYWLYKSGDEFVNRTGGWEVKKEGSTYKASKESTYFHLDSAISNGQSISTINKVDLSNFSTFCFTLKDAVTGSGTNYRAGVVWENESGPTNTYTRIATTVISATAADVELSVDISDLNAAYKLGFISWNGQVFNVDKVWLV